MRDPVFVHGRRRRGRHVENGRSRRVPRDGSKSWPLRKLMSVGIAGMLLLFMSRWARPSGWGRPVEVCLPSNEEALVSSHEVRISHFGPHRHIRSSHLGTWLLHVPRTATIAVLDIVVRPGVAHWLIYRRDAVRLTFSPCPSTSSHQMPPPTRHPLSPRDTNRFPTEFLSSRALPREIARCENAPRNVSGYWLSLLTALIC